VAEDLERWTERTPARRTLYDRTPTFGVAREAERRPEDLAPAGPEPGPAPRRERGPFVTYMQMPWSWGDREPGDRWRRMRCRWGRHQICGGETMQVGGAVVFIERRCRWCGAQPAV
jgi:hypothetical protein